MSTSAPMTILVEKGSTHEAAVRCAAEAGASLDLVRVIGPARGFGRPANMLWTAQGMPTRVLVASLRQIQNAVAAAHAAEIRFGLGKFAEARAIAFEPVAAFNEIREFRRTSPLVADLVRDPVGFYTDALVDLDLSGPPVITLDIAEEETSQASIGRAATASQAIRLNMEREVPGLCLGRVEAETWRRDGYRTQVSFAAARDMGLDEHGQPIRCVVGSNSAR